MATAIHESDSSGVAQTEYAELEHRWSEAALQAGRLLGQANIGADYLPPVIDALAEARREGRIVSASELILHISADEAELPDIAQLNHMRTFLEAAFPDIDINSFSPLQLQRICQEIPIAAEAAKDRFHHKTQASLESQLRRLSRYLAGELDAQVAKDETVTTNAIRQGRLNLGRAIGQAIDFEDVTDAASARLIAVLAEKIAVQEAEPKSVEEVVINIRDGKLVPAEEPDFSYESTDGFDLPSNFEAEVVTFLNTQRTNVHINHIIYQFFNRRLEAPEYLRVKRALYELRDQGWLVYQGRGYFATYGSAEELDESLAAESQPDGFSLPEDFEEQVLAIAGDLPSTHIAEVVRSLFGDRLPPDQFALVRRAINDMCSTDKLINLGGGNFRAGGLSPNVPAAADHYTQRQDLNRMLRDAGIHDRQGFKPKQRSRRR